MLDKNLFLLAVLFLMNQSHCNNGFGDNRGPRYDIRQISVGQHSVYFKREIRGRNYEGFSISSDGNLCNAPSPKTDFFVGSETIGKTFYKVKGDELQIYSQNEFTPPQTDNFPVKIVQRKLPNVEHSEENAIKLGYTELLLPDDSLKYCNK
ncbi:MAG: hypothetical protein LH614_15710 [Pyrinomonadaceae bacterium]|nr:hypothetical protein [Pyrinomonadaceae bacterium]